MKPKNKKVLKEKTIKGWLYSTYLRDDLGELVIALKLSDKNEKALRHKIKFVTITYKI